MAISSKIIRPICAEIILRWNGETVEKPFNEALIDSTLKKLKYKQAVAIGNAINKDDMKRRGEANDPSKPEPDSQIFYQVILQAKKRLPKISITDDNFEKIKNYNEKESYQNVKMLVDESAYICPTIWLKREQEKPKDLNIETTTVYRLSVKYGTKDEYIAVEYLFNDWFAIDYDAVIKPWNKKFNMQKVILKSGNYKVAEWASNEPFRKLSYYSGAWVDDKTRVHNVLVMIDNIFLF
jgi:hypothetical protein